MRYILRKVRLNRGGYDSLGTYWGEGPPLYQWLTCDAEDDWHWLRAASREAAKQKVRAAVAASDPNPRFWA